MKIWQIIFSMLCLLAVLVSVIANVVMLTDSEDCSICGHLQCHAPCILNLNTGEIGELELYIPHAQKVGEIAEEQAGGTFGFVQVAGLNGIKQTDPWYVEINIPMEGNKKRLTHFCGSCRNLLEGYESGFVLLDIYDDGNPMIFKIEDGAEHVMRCYKIDVSANPEKESFLLRLGGVL